MHTTLEFCGIKENANKCLIIRTQIIYWNVSTVTLMKVICHLNIKSQGFQDEQSMISLNS